MTASEEKFYDDLADSTEVPAANERFDLEDILAEYGGSRQQQIIRDVDQQADPEGENPSEEALPTIEIEELELPKPPRPLSMEQVVGSTVDAVLEEEEEEPILSPKKGLFSRKKLVDTEELYAEPEPPKPPKPKPKPKPEPPLLDSVTRYRNACRKNSAPLPLAFLLALLPTAAQLVERSGAEIPYWTGDPRDQTLALLCILTLVCLLCRRVFVRGWDKLCRNRLSCEALISLSALAAGGDCLVRLLHPERSEALPYVPVAVLALVFAQWGISREDRGFYDLFRTAALDEEPPYLVTDTGRGACKQRGSVPGFTTAALAENLSAFSQGVFLPVILAASLVFAGLASAKTGGMADFLLNWSAILSGGAALALPLCWALPFSKQAHHLQKVGCAVAGWVGAEAISRRRTMILSDADLFPPGTIKLNGVKVYGEELRTAVAYAAAMSKSAGSGLERLFEGLRRSECAMREKVDGFGFYEEGGWSGTIHGESVLMGTTSFMHHMGIRLPGDVHLKTGIFLAVDRNLIAVFAIKYQASENVDYALKVLRRCHITPILAARDPNITPALLKRKFNKNVKMEFPSLTDRVALSEAEQDKGAPKALLFREGLLPYAEAVAGSRRLCTAVRRSTVLSLFGSAAGTLLSAYLVHCGKYLLLNPVSMVAFLLLWVLPVLLMSDWAGRY